ncbi:trehalose-phosphatase [Galactobacter valiniphilus]|uniref:Trehalose 6-phosphate phosphatase n=1 Tax=Galactobacter valiniphilus TaxID=2676122 RepID=A0A399J9T2_9MICC|nr:trehalose-phosphatase [Galactobacter valiniphilus]RII40949.1 trehalose-phosphatase [Galactobacter valiniphilus]
MTGLGPELRTRVGKLARVGHLLVALDFDGTLAPFTDVPDEARALPASARAIDVLAALTDTDVALISGRELASLRRVAAPGEHTLLVGSHGAERWAPEEFDAEATQAELTKTQRKVLAATQAALEAVAERFDGLWVEPKPAGAVLHTRLAAGQGEQATQAALRALAKVKGAHVREGKDVIEASVLGADKGQGLIWLREVSDAAVVLFVGDDRTDEDAFAVLRKQDVGIKVGPGPTQAEFRVDGPGDVADLLQLLADVRE